MLNIKTSLDTISHEYTVFEADQVLTHEQLNGVVDYLSDQDRLTRVDLVGVGIYCGLRAALAGNRVKLTRGVGVTTDGDIARVPADVEYTHYRRYSDNAPLYPKLVPGGTPLRTWELLSSGTIIGAAPLTGFQAAEGVTLSSLSALLLVESVDLDNDICSDTNCDSRGDRATETLRLLLVDATAAASVAGAFYTPDAAAPLLDEIVVDRPLLSGVTTVGGLVARYREACSGISGKLATALPKLHAKAGAFLWDSDPTPGWLAKLSAMEAAFASSGFGIQYYYGYLKDVVETYGALRERLSGDTSICVPDPGAFPKHLVLGRIVPGSGADARIGFYPSAIVRAAVDRGGHARFLASKLGVLIAAWQLPAAGAPLRITPSSFGDRSLEDRAIPYYYSPGYTPRVHESWSFALARRGMSSSNLGYHVAGSPLEADLSRFTFFRVEGHLGHDVEEVTSILEQRIREYNLPITIATGLLRANEPESLAPATELRGAQAGARAQLAGQIEQVVVFARRAVSRLADDLVHGAAAASVEPMVRDLEEQAADLKAGREGPSEGLQAWTDWRAAAGTAIRQAAEIRAGLDPLLTKLEEAAFDALVKGRALESLELIEHEILDEEQGSSSPLFISHLAQQPGLEHFAGASRGTTLLLVYDENGHVIADFMLPCCNCEVLAEADLNAGGAREAVSAVYARTGLIHEYALPIGSQLQADRLADGLRLVPGVDIELAAATEADCSVVLELPYPATEDGMTIWTPSSPVSQEVALRGAVSMNAGDLMWTPLANATSWLQQLAGKIGPPALDFFTGDDEMAPGWLYGPQRQLVYNDQSSRPLERELPVLGGAAVYQRPASSSDLRMHAYWPDALQPDHPIQTGFILDLVDPSKFTLLLYQALLKPASGGFEVVSTLDLLYVHLGVVHGIVTYQIQSRSVGQPFAHPPIEIRFSSSGVHISEISNTGFLSPWHTPHILNSYTGKRFGAFTTVPTEIWELGDGVQSLRPPSTARIRARLHLDRRAATWAGPVGQKRPFIPDFNTWFWIYPDWPIPQGPVVLGSNPPGYGLVPENHGIGMELIR
jgi:hypothetical protein